MRAKYKLLFFVPLIMSVGCNREHKMVVQKVVDNKIVAKDTNSGKNQVIVMNTRYEHLAYVYSGDTIEYIATRPCLDVFRNTKRIDIPDVGYLKFDKDSLMVRQDRRFFQNTKDKIWARNR